MKKSVSSQFVLDDLGEMASSLIENQKSIFQRERKSTKIQPRGLVLSEEQIERFKKLFKIDLAQYDL